MRQKTSTKFLRSFLCCVLASIAILQSSITLFAQTVRNPSDFVTGVDAQETTISDGYQISEKTAADVNAFLGADGARSEVTENLYANGVNPDDVKYVRVASDPTRAQSDELDQLAGTVRSVDPSLIGVEMWIGGAESGPDLPVGAVLLVGNRADGTQTLLNWMVANDAAMQGTQNASVGNGDFYASDAVVGGQVGGKTVRMIGFAFLICWIQCFLVRQILIQLRCIIITIIRCWRVGPFIICVGIRLVICQLRIWIRFFIVCYIRCILVVIVISPPPGAVQGVGAVTNGLLNRPGTIGKSDKRSRDLLGRKRAGRSIPPGRQLPALT